MKESRKNRGNGLIWAIILVVIVAIVVTFIVIAKSRKYDPGKTDNGIYLNKWADVQIRIPDGLTIYQKQNTDSLYSELYMKSSTESSQMFGFAAYKDPSIDTGMEEMKQVFLQAVGRPRVSTLRFRIFSIRRSPARNINIFRLSFPATA